MFLFGILSKITDYIFPHKCICCSRVETLKSDICPACWCDLNFVVRPYCKICGVKFDFAANEDDICGKCMNSPPHYDRARSLMKFDEFSKKLIHNFKYCDKTHYSSFFAKLFVSRYKYTLNKIDYVVPIPMHRLKRLYRGYNQSQLLGKEISNIIGKPIIVDLLIKHKWTKSQTFLTKNQRLNNINGSISINNKYNVSGKSILLIDDVHTTGTTVNICSKILKNIGKVNEIIVGTIAMT